MKFTKYYFVALARRVVEARGEPRDGAPDSRIYEDDRIQIRTNYNGLDLEVTRKKMPNSADASLRTVDNPTTMVSDGKIIRHHGEAYAVEDHLERLARIIRFTLNEFISNTAEGFLDYGYGHPVVDGIMNDSVVIRPFETDKIPVGTTHIEWFYDG